MNFRLSNRADWSRIVDYVKTLSWRDADGKAVFYRVSVEALKPNRSTQQNARYWALVTAVSQQAPQYMGGEWHAPEVWHEYLKRRFLGMESGPWGNGVPRSTTKLKVGEFADYMTEVEAWAQDEFPEFEFGYEEAA